VLSASSSQAVGAREGGTLSAEGDGVAHPIVSEEDGVWFVRVLAQTDELKVQEYRCASEELARHFAALFLALDSDFPPQHGQIAERARERARPWWRKVRWRSVG
jgi:hypothetical protein